MTRVPARNSRVRPYTRVTSDRQPELVREIVEAYESGDSIAAIAQATGPDPSIISRILTDAGVTIRSSGAGPVEAELAARVLSAYADGNSMETVAGENGCSVPVVRKILTDAGVPVRNSTAGSVARARKNTPEIIAAYTSGETVTTIVARTGHNRQTVRRILTAAGITLRSERPVTSAARAQQDAPEIVAAYTSGETVAAIAARTGHPAATISRILTAAGVPVRSNPVASAARARQNTPEIIAAYTHGEPLSGIAARMGHTPTTIRNILTEAGVPLRPRSHPRRSSTPRQRYKRRPPLTDSERQAFTTVAVTAYQQGASIDAICQETGLRYNSVRNLLLAAGVTLRRPGRGTRRPRHPTDTDTDSAKESRRSVTER